MIAGIEKIDQKIFMIAFKEINTEITKNFKAACFRQPGQPPDDLESAVAPVDVIAEKNQHSIRGFIVLRIAGDFFKQRIKKIYPPVDVADGVDRSVCGHARFYTLVVSRL